MIIGIFTMASTKTGCDQYEEPTTSESVPSQPVVVPSGDGTSKVADPTEYTYRATPITKLPYATTRSLGYKTAKPIQYPISPATYSVARTAPMTNVQTPGSTAHSTPHSTPHSTAHKTPFSTVHSTAHKTPFSTMHSTPHSTPFSTMHSTPHSTAHSTPHSTAHKTPFSTMHSTPHSTAHSTPHSTPHSTAHSTPHSTPRYTISPSASIAPAISSVNLGENSTETMNIITGTQTKKKNWLPIIIGAIVGFLLLAAIIAFLIFWFKKREESSDDSICEMQEETVINYNMTEGATITNDNPLWKTSITLDISDDPFKNDFEEAEAAEDFFAVREKFLDEN